MRNFSQSLILNDCVALVTGGAMGIGESIARAYSDQGAKVLIADIDPSGQGVADSLGEAAHFFKCDVSEETEVEKAVAVTIEKFGRLDVMVNNAGIGSAYDDPTQISEQDMDRVISINQKGVMFGIKYAARAMQDNGGSIINMASIAALSGGTSGFIYTGAKGAVAALTRSAALHLGDRNIRVNALAPGIILTPIYEKTYPDGIAEKVLSRQTQTQQPLRRLGEGADVAGPAIFLASDLSAYVTGQVIAVDGGYSSSHRGGFEAGYTYLQELLAEA